MQNYICVCCFIRLWNMGPHNKDRIDLRFRRWYRERNFGRGGSRRSELKGAIQWGVSWSVLITRFYPATQIKKSEICEVYGTCGGVVPTSRFCCGNLRKRDYLEDLEVHGRIILKWILNGMQVWRLDTYVSGWGQGTIFL
jgi:hypothetical protein